MRSITSVLLLLSLSALVIASEDDIPDEHAWFFEDHEEQSAAVSDGELRFLTGEDSSGALYTHSNIIRIDADSISTGWANQYQCHNNIDPLSALQITYRKDTTRAHEVVSSRNIARAWVEAGNVELEGIEEDAEICIRFMTRNTSIVDGEVKVRNGPFMRRFLDGYYPMRVQLRVDYPCSMLRFDRTNHADEAGYLVRSEGCQVEVDTAFEGKLHTELLFQKL